MKREINNVYRVINSYYIKNLKSQQRGYEITEWGKYGYREVKYYRDLNKVTERLAVSRDRVTKLQKVTTTRDL
jgi:hypothetical protein